MLKVRKLTSFPSVNPANPDPEADLCYLAYLAKKKSLDYKKVGQKYDVKEIKKLASSSTTDDLLNCSKGHSKSVEKYAIK